MKLSILSSTIAIALVTAAGAAHAGAFGTSTVQVTDFQIFKVSTGTQLDRVTDFSSLSFTSAANVLAGLNGVNSVQIAPQPSIAAGSDLLVQQGELTGYVNNSFAVRSSGNVQPTANYAIADQREIGSPIAGLLDGAGNLYAGNANLGNSTYASLAAAGASDAASTNTLGASFTFTPTFSDILRFQFNLTTYLEAFVGPANAIAPTAANASYNVVFTLTDQTDGSFLLNRSISDSVSALSPQNNGVAVISLLSDDAINDSKLRNFVFDTTGALVAGRTYNLSANATSTANALKVVPEPGALALLGLGMVGMASMRRRQAR